MDDPDWAKILQYLHNHNGEIRETAEDNEEDEDDRRHEEHEQALYDTLSEKVDISRTDEGAIVDTHKHLQNTGLVDFEQRADYAALKLTTEGFEVAHERELSKRDREINSSLVFFTFILVIVNILDVIPIDPWILFGLSLALLILMWYVSVWDDTLKL